MENDMTGRDPAQASISLNVPEYEYIFRLRDLPYFRPKELWDLRGNWVDYDPLQGVFMACKTEYDDKGKSNVVCENGEAVPLYPVTETDIMPYKEDGLVQITDYNCGPAAALQTLELLAFNGHAILPVPTKTKKLWYSEECCADGDPENTDLSNQKHYDAGKVHLYAHSPYVQCYRAYSDKQIAMMEAAGTTWCGTLDAKGVAVAINQYFKEKQYIHMDIKESRAGDIKIVSDRTFENLRLGYPVIYMVNVKSLVHYDTDDVNEPARHYITAVGYRRSRNCQQDDVITVIDPNYNYKKRGKYTVTLQELVHSMTQAGVDLNGNFIC